MTGPRSTPKDVKDADKRRLDALAEAERQLVRLKVLYEPDVADADEPVFADRGEGVVVRLEAGVGRHVDLSPVGEGGGGEGGAEALRPAAPASGGPRLQAASRPD